MHACGAWCRFHPSAPSLVIDADSTLQLPICCFCRYAAALSTSLSADKPLGVDVLGSKVVLFRDATTGDIACLDDTCVHRGAPLSGGSLTVHSGSGKTCVVCPYHGWAFDGEGHLKDVPSAEPGRWPKRPIASSHPVSRSSSEAAAV